jgi:hypothetical protein
MMGKISVHLCGFFQDIRKVDWNEFMSNYAYGARQYVLKYDPATIAASFGHVALLFRAHQVTIQQCDQIGRIFALIYLGQLFENYRS